jgi:hypothetical protein
MDDLSSLPEVGAIKSVDEGFLAEFTLSEVEGLGMTWHWNSLELISRVPLSSDEFPRVIFRE